MNSLLWTALGFAGAVFLWLLKLLDPLLQKDLEEGVPWFAAWLIRRAARKLPAKYQQRFEEEWLAELAAVPGALVFKLRFAACVSLRARSTSRAMQNLPPWWEEVLRRLLESNPRARSLSVTGAMLRLIVLAFHREDPRRQELLAELHAVPRWERPFWVMEQLEVALFEGIWHRIRKR
jgi:hypothetical protein